jgi:hypothetical protein
MSSNKRSKLESAREQDPPPNGSGSVRVIVTGDRLWSCNPLAASIIRRLVDRYGPGLVIVHGGATGVDESFEEAARGLCVTTDPHPADWDRLGKRAGPVRNRAMVEAGAELCIALHRFLMNSKGTKDCCRQAIAAGIPTYLISDASGVPRRLLADDPRLE